MKHPQSGLSIPEVFLGILILLVLFSVLAGYLASRVTPSLREGSMAQLVSNMKQLHLATQQMTLDSETANTPPNIRWTCTNGQPLKFAQWTNLLVSNNYLAKEDLAKLLRNPFSNTQSTNVITVYAVGDFDPPETIVFATANWRAPSASHPDQPPLDIPGIVIFRKGSDGAILQRHQIDLTNIATGGRYNYLPLQ
ncbi:hypothetical protein DB345_08485 [Spartobacteria bacterium LR76]|nr:hypothetical protein DB345_08485 [Spartobacteria bacterium LR76]